MIIKISVKIPSLLEVSKLWIFYTMHDIKIIILPNIVIRPTKSSGKSDNERFVEINTPFNHV